MDILNGRYKTIGNGDAFGPSNLGIVHRAEDYSDPANPTPVVIKCWTRNDTDNNDVLRALWDLQLRNLYKISSKPNAEKYILTLHDAGVDYDNSLYTIVEKCMSFSQYSNLSDALSHRESSSWLDTKDISCRADIWRGLRNIAEGLSLLHEEHFMHRHLTVESIFYDASQDPSSFRLAGFEWTVRIGLESISDDSSIWIVPPEVADDNKNYYSFFSDWFLFGVLATRCLCSVESLSSVSQSDRLKRLKDRIYRIPNKSLDDIEKKLILSLLSKNPFKRPYRARHVITSIDHIIWHLERKYNVELPSSKNLILLYNPRNNDLLEAAYNAGFKLSSSDVNQYFNPNYQPDCDELSRFIEECFESAMLCAVGAQPQYILVGSRMEVGVVPYKPPGEDNSSWSAAFIIGPKSLLWNSGGDSQRDLVDFEVIVRTAGQYSGDGELRAGALSWEKHLPTAQHRNTIRESVDNFLNFIRFSNQLELLFLDAEIFNYQKISESEHLNIQKVTIKAGKNIREVLPRALPEKGMLGHLRSVLEGKRNKKYSRVLLTELEEDSLRTEKYEESENFTIDRINDDEETVELSRTVNKIRKTVPENGTLRVIDMFGQVSQIRRRTDAVKRLEEHSYLLRSLCATGQVFIDSGKLGLPIQVDRSNIDEGKEAVTEDILRVRPIYTLQGPPGTGKTTLVSVLVKQIFEEDPVAQVLITAQAHGAVDVLRKRIEKTYQSESDLNKPILVRLKKNSDSQHISSGSAPDVARNILTAVCKYISDLPLPVDEIQAEWLDVARSMLIELGSISMTGDASEFTESVKRAASITFCTTASGDLEELSKEEQRYDWSIIEEAGKCHGFELAMPLLAGHRWLLIGDQKQLKPFKYEDYVACVDNIHNMNSRLRSMPKKAAGMLDHKWLRFWDSLDGNSQEAFANYCKHKFATFDSIFQSCTRAPSESKQTLLESVGALAGVLTTQYRMHPDIGDIVSSSFYQGVEIKNGTIDSVGNPIDDVKIEIDGCVSNNGKSIIWIDTDNSDMDDKYSESDSSVERYTNVGEMEIIKNIVESIKIKSNHDSSIELAVLSTYTKQRNLLNDNIDINRLGDGISVVKTGDGTSDVDQERPDVLAHTVDSFQGNEADIVIVSLVRKNSEGKIGFIDEASRVNVLLSRAKRLLIIVGAWEFFVNSTMNVPANEDVRGYGLKMALEAIAEKIESGKALKVSADSLSVD